MMPTEMNNWRFFLPPQQMAPKVIKELNVVRLELIVLVGGTPLISSWMYRCLDFSLIVCTSIVGD